MATHSQYNICFKSKSNIWESKLRYELLARLKHRLQRKSHQNLRRRTTFITNKLKHNRKNIKKQIFFNLFYTYLIKNLIKKKKLQERKFSDSTEIKYSFTQFLRIKMSLTKSYFKNYKIRLNSLSSKLDLSMSKLYYTYFLFHFLKNNPKNRINERKNFNIKQKKSFVSKKKRFCFKTFC